MISERTKAGLAAAKARGKRLGGLNEAGIASTPGGDCAMRRRCAPLLTEMEAAGMSARATATEFEQAIHSDPDPGHVARHAGAAGAGAP